MSFLRVSPRLAELLAAPGNRAVFERERSVSAFLVEIEQAMIVQGLSKRRLAERMGKQAQAVSRALQGRQNLTIGTMVDLALALGKTVEVRVVDLPVLQAATDSALGEDLGQPVWTSRQIG